ncbi:PDR/VanB family oxidoreductase [Georgenia sp. AZ-5]|uniref:PDR/VanB family oxidoreductase n=1 Tax=Georgenia sp. AZ-5 TaxID=3367526 RepID=UPI0037550C2C
MTIHDVVEETTTLEDPFALRDLVIEQVTLEAEKVLSVRFAALDGAELPGWEPGSHLDVVLPSGKVRQFSLCGDPADRTSYTVAVLREDDGRGGSVELHEYAIPGRTLKIRGPRNHFEFVPAHSYLFIAGGIGITPLLPMVREAAREGASWRLVYAGRSRGTMPFLAQLAELTGIAGGEVVLYPKDETGRADLASLLADLPPDTHVYCCGPGGVIEEVERRCGECLPEEALHVERFTAGEAAANVHAEIAEAGGTFEVVLARSGATAIVGPGCTVLDAIRDIAPDVLTDCEEGYCGTCETKVIEGEPEHHDTILTAKDRAKNRCMMICVGRAKSDRLVLDL